MWTRGIEWVFAVFRIGLEGKRKRIVVWHEYDQVGGGSRGSVDFESVRWCRGRKNGAGDD